MSTTKLVDDAYNELLSAEGIPFSREIYAQLDEEMRRINVILICNSLKKYAKPENEQLIAEKARIMEQSCYDTAILKSLSENIIRDINPDEFNRRYQTIAYRIISNLDPDITKSDYFVKAVVSGELNASEVGKMDSVDLCPEKHVELVLEYQKRSQQKIEIQISRVHTCRRCKQDKTTETQVQLRRADEAPSYVITCTECGNRWVLHG
ncbi:MAG TPA: hypothetical protein VI821_00045 [Candidatus Paceibacterota bacterium]